MSNCLFGFNDFGEKLRGKVQKMNYFLLAPSPLVSLHFSQFRVLNYGAFGGSFLCGGFLSLCLWSLGVCFEIWVFWCLCVGSSKLMRGLCM